MIFLYTGSFIFVIGLLFRLFPSKHMNRLYGYRSFLAEKNDDMWCYAQKISGNMSLLMGGIGIGIGLVLKMMHWINYFMIELLLIAFLIIPIFIVTEKKLEQFEQHQEE